MVYTKLADRYHKRKLSRAMLNSQYTSSEEHLLSHQYKRVNLISKYDRLKRNLRKDPSTQYCNDFSREALSS